MSDEDEGDSEDSMPGVHAVMDSGDELEQLQQQVGVRTHMHTHITCTHKSHARTHKAATSCSSCSSR